MRLSNDRYNRDLRSFTLAVRMLSYEARTNTVCAWTGLSPERVRKLSKVHRREGVHKNTRRPGGPSPTKLAAVLTTPSLRSEAAAMAGVCRMLEVIPAQPVANAWEGLPNVGRGERLCSALELFRNIVPYARFSLEQLVLLVVALAEGEEWRIDRCRNCSALVVIDQLALEPPVCEECQHRAKRKRAAASKLDESKTKAPTDEPKHDEESQGMQLGLFDTKDTEDSG